MTSIGRKDGWSRPTCRQPVGDHGPRHAKPFTNITVSLLRGRNAPVFAPLEETLRPLPTPWKMPSPPVVGSQSDCVHFALPVKTGLSTRNRNPSPGNSSDQTLENYHTSSPTPLRLFTAISYLLSLVFLILVCIGNISGKAVIRSTFFLKIDMSNIIPESVPNAAFINSIARTIGLHDFYQVGVWNFCAGYNGQGITHCSTPQTLYWFNPVEIIVSELLAGATIALPIEVVTALRIVRIASHWMFGSFLAGTCLTFLCLFFAPMAFSSRPRWSHKGRRIFFRSLPITILTFLAILFTAGASTIATVMFVIFRNTFSGAADLNIEAQLGTPMLAFMWIGCGFNLIGFLMQMGTCCGVCCCTGRRKAIRLIQAIDNGSPTAEKELIDRAPKRRFGFKNKRM